MRMIEQVRVEFHPWAQPVRCSIGWVMACYAPCDLRYLTLLIDPDRPDQRPPWTERPDPVHRTVLMLSDPDTLLVRFDLDIISYQTIAIAGAYAHISIVAKGQVLRKGYNGFYYELAIIISSDDRP